jgi:hypothetical protein
MPDIVTSKIFVDGEKGITATKMNQIISGATIQPDFVNSKPASSTLDPTDQILELKGGATYATITGQQLIDSVSSSVTQNITPAITAVRLRSFNGAGNPSFEVDQVNAHTATAMGAGSVKACDRWFLNTVGTMRATTQALNSAWPNFITLPGTPNFNITRTSFRVTLTTAQATLGATDALHINQICEGIQFRELAADVHSISLLVRTSVAGLKFGLSLRDPTGTRSLCKLCTIPSASQWTLITLPNLPVWPTAGAFSPAVGTDGYRISICLAAGTTYIAPANDTWQNGSFFGALGQDSFASKATSSTFEIAYIQHEPGNQCTTLMDVPFDANLAACQRCYQKSFDYTVPPGSIGAGARTMSVPAATTVAYGPLSFYKPLAKTPTVVLYNHAAGTAASVRDATGVDHAGATAGSISTTGFASISFSVATAGATGVYLQYAADSGW